jgi:2-polyprenyl-6-methoxyphenol hydroxylase-like FAD-dependent oxidoreductase
MKQYVLTKLRSSKVPLEALELVQSSEMSGDAPAAPLRFRSPLSLIFAGISKGNVCVAGDALHPMTPDLGQGGCAALEDGVVLARCLGEAIIGGGDSTGGVTERERIESGLQKYAGIRRWRSIELIGTAYTVGFLQQSDNTIVSFLREKVLAGVLARRLVKMSNYDCGTLSS